MSTLVDPITPEDQYRLSMPTQLGQDLFHGDIDEISSDVDDHQMMIQNPVDGLSIVVPQHSSNYMQQDTNQFKRSQFTS